jgi:hypothetical protein
MGPYCKKHGAAYEDDCLECSVRKVAFPDRDQWDESQRQTALARQRQK